MYRAEEFTLACAVFDQALIEIHGPFLGFYDVKQGYLCRCFGEIEAAANSTLGTDDAVLDQRLEYLGEKCWGDILLFADIFFVDDLPDRLAGHVKDGTDGVF